MKSLRSDALITAIDLYTTMLANPDSFTESEVTAAYELCDEIEYRMPHWEKYHVFAAPAESFGTPD